MAQGVVYLVGAGPGDAGLITQKGLHCLHRADVVVYDRLVSPALLGEAPLEAERICAAKSLGKHRMSQDEINARLIDYAKADKVVVRLKGGDPFLFGRGGEEAEALVEAGVRVEIVHGVSSAIAAPAAAGIPVTHRGVSDGFAVWTAHCSDKRVSRPIDAPTQVVLMGVNTLEKTVAELLRMGRHPKTPAAVVSWATTAWQRSVQGTLADIVSRVEAAGLTSPATVVVGDVVAVAAKTKARDVYGQLAPGRRVVVTWRPSPGDPLIAGLELSGDEVAPLPIAQWIQKRDERLVRAARDMIRFDAVFFADALAVEAVMEERLSAGLDVRSLPTTRFIAAEEDSRTALRHYGIVADHPSSLVIDGEKEFAVFEGASRLGGEWANRFEVEGRVERISVAVWQPVPQTIRALIDLADEGMIDAVVFDHWRSLDALQSYLDRERTDQTIYGVELFVRHSDGSLAPAQSMLPA